MTDEREYVSRLWAEDWDSPEDAAYDRKLLDILTQAIPPVEHSAGIWRQTTQQLLVRDIEKWRETWAHPTVPMPPKKPGKGVRGLAMDYVIYDELAD